LRRSALLWGPLLLAAVLRLFLALHRPLQVDEAYSIHQAAQPLADALRDLVQRDVHPPLFLVLTHALFSIGARDIALRSLMVVFGLAGVALLFAIVRLWHDERAASIAALCAALMPSLIFYDTVIRMYALFDALALASFALLSLLYVRADLTIGQRRLLWSAWVAVTALLWYTQYLGFIVTAAQLLYAAVLRRDGLVRSLAGCAAAIGLFAPQVHALREQLPVGGLAFPFYASHQLQALFELVGQATIAVQTHGGGGWVIAASVVAWLWLIMDATLAARAKPQSLAVWLLAPAALTLLVGWIAHKLLYADRYYLVLAYGLCACAGVATVQLVLLRTPIIRIGLGAGAAVLAALAILYTADPAFYTADWPAVAATIDGQARGNDLVVLEQGSPWFVLQQPELALQRGARVHVRPWLPLFTRASVARAPQLSAPYPRVWLVLFQWGPVDPGATLLHTFERRYPRARVWYFTRALPAEDVVVVLFQR